MNKKLFEPIGFILSILFFFFTLAFTMHYTGEYYYSTLASIFSGLLFWGTYIILRVCILAGR